MKGSHPDNTHTLHKWLDKETLEFSNVILTYGTLEITLQIGTLTWDVEALARELHLSVDDTLTYFQDGRRCSFITERRIAREFIGGRIADSEGAAYDVFDQDDKKWEVRSLTNSGIYFCPSYMVGSGRKFEEKGFLAKIEEIEGYYIAMINTFPNVPVYKVSSDQVLAWYKAGRLGKSTSISFVNAMVLLRSIA